MKGFICAVVLALAMLAVPHANAQAPTCPTGVNHCAQLSWAVGSGGGAPTGYNVYRATVTGGCSTVTASTCHLTGSTTGAVTFLDSPLAATTSYFWVVTATNTAGESAPSAQVTATTGADPIITPAAPINLTVTAK